MNDGLISIIIFCGQSFHRKASKNILSMGFHPCFIDCQDNRSGSAFLNSLEAITDCSLPLDLRHYPKSHLCFTSLSQDFEFRNQQNPFVFFCELIGSSVNQPPQPCCVDLNGRSINCESRFDTSIPARSIFWTW